MPENTANNNVFCLQPVQFKSCYGPRLWVPSVYEPNLYEMKQKVRKVVGKLSLWGDTDKSGENCKAWEFRDNAAMNEAARVLREEFGYSEIPQTEFFDKYPYV